MGTLPGRGEHLIHHFMVPLPLFAAQALQGKACESPLRHGAKASLRIVGAAVCLVLLPLYTSSRLCKTRLWSTKKRDVILFASLSNYISLSVLRFRLPIKKQTKLDVKDIKSIMFVLIPENDTTRNLIQA